MTVFAAASLQNAFKELGTLFQRKTGAQVDFNFGASNTLQTQIEQGAQVDVFASASLNEVQALSRQGLLEGDPSVFARNRLVIAVPRDNPARISTLHDLARPGVKFVTAQPGVPVGRYTVQMLDLASRDPAYGADFKQRVEANTVSREDNVRAVLGKVALGEADAGVVYATDAATDRDHVTTVPIPDTVNVIAEYPIARLKAAPQPDLAQQFVTLVLSDEGQEVLAKYGFAPAHS